jgi:hypothetical protein
MNTPTVLKRIVARKLEEIAERQQHTTIDDLKLKIKANRSGPMAPRFTCGDCRSKKSFSK